MDTHTIFFIGKPGCGKGTQAKLLSEKTGWQVVSAGEQFRAISSEETPVGHKVKVGNDAGMLQPHWLAMYLYLKSLFALADGASVIFDGFNRKIAEAELVIDSLVWLGRPFSIINIVVSDEEVRERLAGRRDVEKRIDDNAVEERLKEYYEHTDQAISLFRDAGVLIEIDGGQGIEKIAANITTALSLT